MSCHRLFALGPVLGLGLLTGCAAVYSTDFQTQVDVWSQAPTDEVDILWVIDDSASMGEEQQVLKESFSAFAEQLDASGTDFHLGLTTTSFDPDDERRGMLLGDPPFLTSDRHDYVGAFEKDVQVGVSGSDKEKGLEAALYALQPSMVNGGPNDGFLREEAQLLVIFVSDEDDCSDGGALEGQAPTACYTASDELTPVSRLVADFRDLKEGDIDRVQLSAIVGQAHAACPDVYPGHRYLQAAALTGGGEGDICASDWGETLRSLGELASGIRTRFRLSRAAQPETLEVYVEEQPVRPDAVAGWTYDPATWFLEFHGEAVPPRGAQVMASYLVDPTQVAPGTPTSVSY